MAKLPFPQVSSNSSIILHISKILFSACDVLSLKCQCDIKGKNCVYVNICVWSVFFRRQGLSSSQQRQDEIYNCLSHNHCHLHLQVKITVAKQWEIELWLCYSLTIRQKDNFCTVLFSIHPSCSSRNRVESNHYNFPQSHSSCQAAAP